MHENADGDFDYTFCDPYWVDTVTNEFLIYDGYGYREITGANKDWIEFKNATNEFEIKPDPVNIDAGQWRIKVTFMIPYSNNCIGCEDRYHD